MDIKGKHRLKKAIEDVLRGRGFSPEVVAEVVNEAYGRYRENGLGPYINTLARSIVPALPTLLTQQGKTESAKVVAEAIRGMGKAVLISAVNQVWKQIHPGVGVRRGKRSGVGISPAKAALAIWLLREDLEKALDGKVEVWFDIVSVIVGSQVSPPVIVGRPVKPPVTP